MGDLRAALLTLRDHGYQPTYNGRPSCPFCEAFLDDGETHETYCVLVTALAASPEHDHETTWCARCVEHGVVEQVRREDDEPDTDAVTDAYKLGFHAGQRAAQPSEFVTCPLCHDPERVEDMVGGVCLTCADAIAFSQNARRGAVIVPAALAAPSTPEPSLSILPTFEVAQVVGELQPGRRRHDWCSMHGDIGPMESIDAHALRAHGSSAEAIRKARKVLKHAARLAESR